MMNSIAYRKVTVFAMTLFCTNALAQQPAFPGAVGFGINTRAGSGGDLIRVTNLNDTGQGSLRDCVEASGPRVCIFEVSGTISLKTNLTALSPNLTIAGQTAPAPGIMLRGASLVISASDVLVQHLAVRAGDDPDGPPLYARDSLKIVGKRPIQNIVIDHCSFSWAIDELVDVWGDNWDNITMSNNIFSEPLRNDATVNGEKHGYAMLLGASPGKISFIGNLFAHAHNRNPRSAAGNLVFVNNVVYNAGIIGMNLFNKNGIVTKNSIVGNVFIEGPETTTKKPIKLNGPDDGKGWNELLSGTRLYLSDNYAADATDDPWSIVDNESSLSRALLELFSAPDWPESLIALPTSGDLVVSHVLENAGSRPGQRNSVDSGVIADVRNRTGRFITCVVDDGSRMCAKNAGGWPELAKNARSLTVPSNQLKDDDSDGYTDVEEWLHTLSAEVEGRSNSIQPGALASPMPPVVVQD